MTIVCDDEGKFQIIHWPPLPIEDSMEILQLIEVGEKTSVRKVLIDFFLETSIYNGRNTQSNNLFSMSTSF